MKKPANHTTCRLLFLDLIHFVGVNGLISLIREGRIQSKGLPSEVFLFLTSACKQVCASFGKEKPLAMQEAFALSG